MKLVFRMICLMIAVGTIVTPLQAGLFDRIANYFNKSAPVLPPTIKVLIVHDKPGVVLEVKGKYKLYNPHNGDHISTRFIGKRKFIQAVRDGIKWGEEFPGVYQLMIVPDDIHSTVIVDGVEYRGPVFVYDIGGSISVINQVYVEDYLSSILAQRYRNLPDELLASIAITARTAGYFRAENPKSAYWSVDGTQVGYQGYAAIDPYSDIEKAIKATRYMVMTTSPSNDDKVVAFLAEWKQDNTQVHSPEAVVSQITLAEADAMIKRGDHAAQVLAKAFPGSRIELVHYAPEQPYKVLKGEN